MIRISASSNQIARILMYSSVQTLMQEHLVTTFSLASALEQLGIIQQITAMTPVNKNH